MRRSLKPAGKPARVWLLSLTLGSAIVPAVSWAQARAGNFSRLTPMFTSPPSAAAARPAPRKHVSTVLNGDELLRPAQPTLPAGGEQIESGLSVDARLNELNAQARSGNMSHQEYLERQQAILLGN